MKAVQLTGIRELRVADIAKPEIRADNDVLLKIETVGICGSDVHYYETGRIGDQVVEYPYIVGHECAATVAAVGPGVSRVELGQRVAVDPAISCLNCDQCEKGRENTCRNLKFLGCPDQVSGCLCEYIIMPEHCCFPMPDDMSFAQGVLCEPLAIAVYAVAQSGLRQADNIAILGAGPIGLSCLLAAKAKNITDCYMTEKIKERINIAAAAGASWAGNPDKQDIVEQILQREPEGLDVVFECAGQQETLDQAVELLKPGGKLMVIGIPRTDTINFPAHMLRRRVITIINVRRQNRCTQEAIEAIVSGRIDPNFMVTHTFSLERIKEAFELVAGYQDGVVKAMIEF